jgi:hypothetical protein
VPSLRIHPVEDAASVTDWQYVHNVKIPTEYPWITLRLS